MFGKILGAMIGEKIAGRNRGAKGAILGMAAPIIARRAFGPLGLALGGAYVAKKVYDKRKGRPTRSA